VARETNVARSAIEVFIGLVVFVGVICLIELIGFEQFHRRDPPQRSNPKLPAHRPARYVFTLIGQAR
jgi:hypothetical protein